MEIVMVLIAIALAFSCLFALLKSDISDFLARRQLASQKVSRNQRRSPDRN